ncbi:MAG TPA: hypothetical protein VKV33_05330 [Streptosporangiaceae bacterium]|nr:hypothetical protein [Streptosporangiaceae bacterium]
MIRKVFWLSGTVLAGAMVAVSWQDIQRYARMKGISLGKGHPEVVPVEGKTSYPQDPSRAVPDGTGEFDAARRGGPAHSG